MSVENENLRDPRNRLVREKYFCIRPRPLERWLWSQRIPASAERVFWLHWQEGMQQGDWCSELPLRRVARECDLDVSTVTRAYQILMRIGCLRRTDPGRDSANPFQQATAVTEVRLPRELLLELDRHPNRQPNRRPIAAPSSRCEQGRAATHIPPETEAPMGALASTATPASGEIPGPQPVPTIPESPDPFPSLRGRARAQALSQLLEHLSRTERHAYQEALRRHRATMEFDLDSTVPLATRVQLQQLLATLAAPCPSSLCASPSPTPGSCRELPSAQSPLSQTLLHPNARGSAPASSTSTFTASRPPKKLSLFDLGRLHRALQFSTSAAAAPELLRQVVWSIEKGALTRFDTRHALHIALKKIREGLWTRPNRMPPNWTRALTNTLRSASASETCCPA
jgi:hypothetical protein